MKRLLVTTFALAFVGLILWQIARVVPNPPRPNTPSSVTASAASDNSALGNRRAAMLERSSLADALNSPTSDIHADLRLVSAILDTFRTNFPRSGNPVGNNADITAALTGRNSLRLSLIPPDHPAINRAGELCDRWGTPFFFHAESATQMSLRSAGPDKKMWSDDDIATP